METMPWSGYSSSTELFLTKLGIYFNRSLQVLSKKFKNAIPKKKGPRRHCQE
jgi:hypothetical protein